MYCSTLGEGDLLNIATKRCGALPIDKNVLTLRNTDSRV